MRFLLRFLSVFALAVAVIMAVIDMTRSIANATFVYTPFVESWRSAAPQTLQSAEMAVRQTLPAFFWDPVIIAVLAMPGWLVFTVLALLLYRAGYRRPRPQIAV